MNTYTQRAKEMKKILVAEYPEVKFSVRQLQQHETTYYDYKITWEDTKFDSKIIETISNFPESEFISTGPM